jgi:DNA-binding LytR/AlgR family response regulator
MVRTPVINIVIVEDNLIQKDLMEIYIEELGHNVLATFDTGEEALNKMDTLEPDLLLMDINLKGLMNGVDAANEIYSKWGVNVIFTTSQTNFSVLDKAANTNPLDILIKPISMDQLGASLLLAQVKSPKSGKDLSTKYTVKNGHFIFKDGHMFERVPLADLKHIEGGGNYFTLHFKSRKTTLKGTLSELEQELPSDLFCRVNRSSIISIEAVKSFSTKWVVLEDGSEHKVSKSNVDTVLSKLMGG